MAKVLGTDFSEILHGTNEDDAIMGFGGNDTIFFSSGADHIDGGSGSDTIDYSGYQGELSIVLKGSTETAVTVDGIPGDVLVNIENINGGDRDDYFVGDSADNTFRGNDGHDYFVASSGYDTYFGGSGYDTVDYSKIGTGLTIRPTSSGYTTTIAGGVAYDKLDSIENIIGTRFGDVITGDSANNYFRGLNGADTLCGGAGGDVLDGGRGNDVLTGGADADIFQFKGSFGHDIITDFTTGGDNHDVIDLSSVKNLDCFDCLINEDATQQGHDVVIDAGRHGTIVLKNVDIHSLTADHFIF